MHRDLKPENILMVESTGPEANTAIKVVDFGLAAFVKSGTKHPTLYLHTVPHSAPSPAQPSPAQPNLAHIYQVILNAALQSQL